MNLPSWISCVYLFKSCWLLIGRFTDILRRWIFNSKVICLHPAVSFYEELSSRHWWTLTLHIKCRTRLPRKAWIRSNCHRHHYYDTLHRGSLGGGGGAAAQITSNIRPQHLNLRLQLSHHIEDGHHQYQGGGRHGEDQSQPGIVGDDYAGGSGEPGERAEGAFSSLLRMQKWGGDGRGGY